jgi:4-amino-4-deoxy-L-arabinose transferase-like glycosyltransferase
MSGRFTTVGVVAVLLVMMAALMWRPILEESATGDEPWCLATGYAYWQGKGFHMHPDQPPLSKMWSALPLLLMDVKVPSIADDFVEGRRFFPRARPWIGNWRLDEPWPATRELFPEGPANWYYWPYKEAEAYGEWFLHGGTNDADRLLLAGRIMQVALTLLTGLVIFVWVRKLVTVEAALLGLAMWVFNPLALAYGHLIITEAGATLMTLISVYTFIRFLENPKWQTSVRAGLAFGGALLMKYAAILLLPISAILALTFWWKEPHDKDRIRKFLKMLPLMAVAAWALVLLQYAPNWAPAPPLPAEQAAKLGVPGWFQTLRPILIPPDFFKGLALVSGMTTTGPEAYLCGEWRVSGWWYYFPVALAVKTPVALLFLLAAGVSLFLTRYRQVSFGSAAPWLSGFLYLGFAMMGKINIGVRHLLPMLALFTVGTATQFGHRPRPLRVGAWLLCGWLAVTTIRADPFFIEYFNEFAGGSTNGHQYLVDSNLNWGQEVKRLKRFLDERGINHVYLQYFGPQGSIEYYKIPCTLVTVGEARQLQQGLLVISATPLMRPEWQWLREHHTPMARIGYSLFAYNMATEPQHAF